MLLTWLTASGESCYDYVGASQFLKIQNVINSLGIFESYFCLTLKQKDKQKGSWQQDCKY